MEKICPRFFQLNLILKFYQLANLFEKTLINFFDIESFFDDATHPMENHQAGELVTVQQDSALA